jgi:hypothetical protein
VQNERKAASSRRTPKQPNRLLETCVKQAAHFKAHNGSSEEAWAGAVTPGIRGALGNFPVFRIVMFSEME